MLAETSDAPRLSVYDDSSAGTFSPSGLLRAAEALDGRLAAARTRVPESPVGSRGGRSNHLRAASDLPSLRVSRHRILSALTLT